MSLIDNRQSWVEDIARLEEEIAQIQLGEIPELDALEDRTAILEEQVVSISGDLAQEIIDRAQADTDLGLAIDDVEQYVDDAIANIPPVDLTGYATEQYVDDAIGAIPPVDLTGYATEQYVDDAIGAIPPVDLTGYATEQYVDDAIDQEVLDRQEADAILNTQIINSSSDLSRKLLTGQGIDTLIPAAVNIETTDRHYFGAVAHPLNPGYVCYFTDALFVFVDARNPFAANIYNTLTFNTGGSNAPQAITAVDNYVFVAMANGRLYTIDWSDVLNPSIYGYVTIGSGQHFDVATDGANTLFLANTTNFRMYAVNITNRLTPVLINSVVLGAASNFGTGVAFHNNYLYVSNYANKLHTFQKNVGTGEWEQIAVLNTIVQPTRCRIVENSRGEKLLFAMRYNGVDAVFYNLAAPQAPVEVKRLITPSAMGIYAVPFSHDNIVHVGFINGTVGGFSILDISDPKFAGVYTPIDANGSKKFSSMAVILKTSTKTPYFKDKALLLASGVRTGGTSIQKTTLPVELPVISFDSVELLARPTSSSVSGSVASEAQARIDADDALALSISQIKSTVYYRYTLQAADITAKQITLPSTPIEPLDVTMDVHQGIEQKSGLDFTVTGNVLSWSGNSYELLAEVNDNLMIEYKA